MSTEEKTWELHLLSNDSKQVILCPEKRENASIYKIAERNY